MKRAQGMLRGAGRAATQAVRGNASVRALGTLPASAALIAALALGAVLPAAGQPRTSPKKSAPAKAKPLPALAPDVAAAFDGLTLSERRAAERWLRSMTPREKAAQLVVVPFYGENPGAGTRAYRRYRELVRDVRVGGLVLVNRFVGGTVQYAEAKDVVAFGNRMQQHARVPLLVAGDFERGASMRVAGATRFLPAMAYGAANDLEQTRFLGAHTALEARSLGVHWIFAPVADVNSNPDNPVINTRSFGEAPALVSAHVRAFIEGARSAAARTVLVTAKHFPGHGDTSIDSHYGLAVSSAGRERLERVELPPFRAAIEAGADAVMTAHITAPAIESEAIPATVSRAVLTDLLRVQMGFRGIVVTDAMDMQGLAGQFAPGEAAVRALAAGADVLLMPPRPEEAIRAVLAAVKQGRLTANRIDRSVARVLAAKVRVELHRRRTVDPALHRKTLASPEAERRALAAAEAALTLVKNEGRAFPPASPARTAYLILAGRRGSTEGRQLAAEIATRAPQARVLALEPGLSETVLAQTLEEARQWDSIAVAAYSAAGLYPRLIEELTRSGKPVILASFASPYLLRGFPETPSLVAAFSAAPAAETAFVRAIFGEIPVRGRLPVTIPGITAALAAGP